MVYTLPLSLDQDLAVPALCSSRIVSFEGERERERERERLCTGCDGSRTGEKPIVQEQTPLLSIRENCTCGFIHADAHPQEDTGTRDRERHGRV